MDIKWAYVIDKAYSILIDRRLWVSLVTLAIVFSGAAEDLNGTKTFSDQAVNLVILLAGLFNNIAWTVRAPSGRNKNAETVLDDLING